MTIVCIDTQILSWAITKRPPYGNNELVGLATDFIYWIAKQEYKVIVPTIILGELLIAVPEEDQGSVLAQISQDYRVVTFDTACAKVFAEISQRRLSREARKQLNNPDKCVTRAALKADAMIIATAVVNKGTAIYSHNKDLRDMAAGYIEAINFLDAGFQRRMSFMDDGNKK